MNLVAAIGTEFLKLRRSRVPWLVWAGFSLAPLVTGLFMVILKDPESARRLGLLGQKAQLTAATADWPSLLSMLGQAVAVGGYILLAFLTSWVYGREYGDRTLRGLLAIPTSRPVIVTAKTVVVLAWGSVVFAWVIALGFAIGALVGLPGWTAATGFDALARMAGAAALVLALQPVTALFASVGRGYLPGLAWAVLTVAAAQVVAVLGWGAAFPWAVPALVAGAGGAAMGDVPPASILAVIATGLAGLAATAWWWRRADQIV